MAPRALVVGGSGFLGSHVADALTRAGYEVRVFDRTPSPYLTENQEMVVGDIMHLEHLTEAASGCFCVYNFAGIADISQASDRPVETAELNVIGAVNTLEAARRADAQRYVFASSVYVYSDSGSFYRASKQAAERFVEAYEGRYGLQYTVLRYGSLYGPRADERNAVYRMVHRALTEGRIVFSGPRDAKREYIHVYDAAELSVRALDTRYANRHLILSGRETLRVADVMTMLAEILPHDVELVFDDALKDTRYVMTPYAFNPRIGYKLTSDTFVDLGQGLMECIADIYAETTDPSSDGRSLENSLWGMDT